MRAIRVSTRSLRRSKPVVLSRKQLEFAADWVDVLNGKLPLSEFMKKWLTRSEGTTVEEDLRAVKRGDMPPEEFLEKWSTPGKHTGYMRKLTAEIARKYDQAVKELLLMRVFLESEPPYSYVPEYLKRVIENEVDQG